MEKDDELVSLLDAFSASFVNMMDGGDLCRRDVAFYQSHPGEWHRRKFHLLMMAASELRKMQRTITEFALSHATIIPAKDLQRILVSAVRLKPLLQDAVDSWEIDENLAYRQFGGWFAFPEPQRTRR